ncbi:SgcJ/EcaC family oxidoreductase [Prauserella cavernicola]|uniref:SgcJ/EcaC family oxidoreductase n=1 Tax=Prauserella cavernicola TaxID=2800127 RepID=A0A934QPL9_9PSEU|nr:SgcJ/EcaC family oxidoreductase [Prauserella cavernicola]MBK1783188.1 SgcJ/EcaC family oxidoreductase [Prauserella cavernicola]
MGRQGHARLAAVLAAAALLTGGSALLATAEPGDAGKPGESATAAFDRILRQQEDAWHREDAEDFAATFTADADVVTFNGDHLRTRQGIAEGMRYYFDHFIDNTRLRALDEHVRFVRPGLAVIVRTSCQLEPPSTTCREDSYSRNTNVLVEQNGRWLQDSFQNTRVMELPPTDR